MFTNAAIFINGVRTMRNVNVEWDDSTIFIRNRANKRVMSEHPIVETASTREDSMAWDTHDQRGDVIRLVAQVGCGCSGMKEYEFDADYSMSLDRK